ncbi:MAG: MBOAT family protein, partial [Verrucomicrobiaceae bacterium]
MLFNSYTFLLVFLPIALIVWQALKRAPFRVVLGWLVLVSLVYYGVWNPDPNQPWSPKYVLLILGSCTANYYLGRRLSVLKFTRPGKLLLTAGVAANLALLGYYKYAGFLGETLNSLTGWPASVPEIVLPLAISFFTFLQIAYLVDAYRGETEEYHFTDYLLFVTFFPHLIAGPLIHHREMMPQFRKSHHGWHRDFPVALGMFLMGLFKKVVIADNLARIATPIFGLAADDGRDPTMLEAWIGAVAYALQLYFDFSGYSDMALGSARLFGIRFPLNFHSPYKADSIIEFWRRWHMTLSRFLRDYLYIPLGGNRKGPKRRYVNLFLTMLLGGLWHGAGWTFIIWGALHGTFLCVNHAWFGLRKRMSWRALPKPLAIALTFIAVLVGWVFFR